MNSDKEFLHWIADRLVYVYGESENVDFIRKLRSIAESLKGNTPNTYEPRTYSTNSSQEPKDKAGLEQTSKNL